MPVLMRCPFHVLRAASDSNETENETKLTPEFEYLVLNRNQPTTDLQTAYDHLTEQEYYEYISDRRMCL